MLPRLDTGAYKQMPYESIDEKTYHSEISKLGKLSFTGVSGEKAEIDRFCDSDFCEIDAIKNN